MCFENSDPSVTTVKPKNSKNSMDIVKLDVMLSFTTTYASMKSKQYKVLTLPISL